MNISLNFIGFKEKYILHANVSYALAKGFCKDDDRELDTRINCIDNYKSEIYSQIYTLELMITYSLNYSERDELFNLKLKIQDIYKNLDEMYEKLIQEKRLLTKNNI